MNQCRCGQPFSCKLAEEAHYKLYPSHTLDINIIVNKNIPEGTAYLTSPLTREEQLKGGYAAYPNKVVKIVEVEEAASTENLKGRYRRRQQKETEE